MVLGLLDAVFVSTDKNAHLIMYCRFMLPINSMFQSAVGFLGGSDSKESACNVGDLGSIFGLGRSTSEQNSNPLQYSGLEKSMDRGALTATVHEVAKSWTQLDN